MRKKPEIKNVYEKVLKCKGLVDFVLYSGLDFKPDQLPFMQGSLLSVFEILKENLDAIEAAYFLEGIREGREETQRQARR